MLISTIVFGPQKGASPEQVEKLANGLDVYARVLEKTIGLDISMAPGSGASGGLGAGLSLIGATLHPRFDLIMRYFGVDELMKDCDLVITAEGGIDYQTPRGKIPSEVARRAKKQNLPVIVLAGTVGQDADINYNIGIDAFISILQCPSSLESAIREAERLLIEGAESAMRMVTIGSAIRKSSEDRGLEKLGTVRESAVKTRGASKKVHGDTSLFGIGRKYWRLRIRGRYWRG